MHTTAQHRVGFADEGILQLQLVEIGLHRDPIFFA
jgi:hypothetical protein